MLNNPGMERLIIGVSYRLHHVVSPFPDDETSTIFQIESSDVEFVYFTWTTCPFYPDDVTRINNGRMRCIIPYMGQRITFRSFTYIVQIRCFEGFSRIGI